MLKEKFEKLVGPIDDSKKPEKKAKKPKPAKSVPAEKQEEEKKVV